MLWAPFLGGPSRQSAIIVPRLRKQQDEADAIFHGGRTSHERRADQASRFNDVRFALAERWPTADKWPTTARGR